MLYQACFKAELAQEFSAFYKKNQHEFYGFTTTKSQDFVVALA